MKPTPFFNSSDGRQLRLRVAQHIPIISDSLNWCCLCVVRVNGKRGSKTKFKSSTCHVYVCIFGEGFCWALWHCKDLVENPRQEEEAMEEVKVGEVEIG